LSNPVAWIERSEIRVLSASENKNPDFATLNPGYMYLQFYLIRLPNPVVPRLDRGIQEQIKRHKEMGKESGPRYRGQAAVRRVLVAAPK
jgi:hypothetical protein